ncbi:uncharacterized protein LY89DRAFT_76970 [Mollisia scopiformis]|uniref:Uncharacterized protein n=1 Tax=Mollisia scopiformis TaxID=149040 RepID=A0A194X7Q4_MOLSC|nr:uncharacterized protein LY89DRAFT_76970 [Mollisia scopiformis]KUJ16198.1 hypothetical protein LY89DRAFT_76970 [Mollisia scopiformis]
MKLRNRMVQDRPRIEEPAGDETQEDTSSTAPQVGSPVSTRTRSISASDSQQAALAATQENEHSPERGQHAQYYRLDLHEDFILYSQSDTDDGTEDQGAPAFLSPRVPQRSHRRLAPRTEIPQAQGSSSSSGPSGTQAVDYAQPALTPQRQQPPTRIQLPTPSQTDNMMPHFEREPGPWSPNSPINPEGRKRALSNDFPGINQYPKDRDWDDKMQEALKEIERRPEGREDSDEERQHRRRSKRRRKGKRSMETPPSKSTKKDDDRHGKDDDGRGNGQGSGQAVMAS